MIKLKILVGMVVHHELLKRFGRNLRKIRKRKGYPSLEMFAETLPMDRAYYGNVECSKHNSSLSKLFDIALSLDIEPSELLPKLSEIKSIISEIERS